MADCATDNCERGAYKDWAFCYACEMQYRAAVYQGLIDLQKFLSPRLAFAQWREEHGIKD